METYFVLVAWNDFRQGEKLRLRWRGPHIEVKTLIDYGFNLEDFRKSLFDSIHVSVLKLYHGPSLNTDTIT